ncbi:MAG: RNA methyltransferase [Crocinitomicaceae bacterium]|nr:RNA methyltransferase [Crocinitomicaceae bacterium]
MNKKLKLEELQRLSIFDYKKAQKDPIIVVLENVRSLNNIGSIFRTCDAMAIQKIYLCGISAQPPHREIRKTAIGATESVDWEYQENVLDVIIKYQKLDYNLIAVEQTSKAISLEKYENNRKKTLLVFGNEINGVSQRTIDKCDISLEIPQWGTKHSLNISVTTGIILWMIKMKNF